jgi:hypothetical protein
MQKRVREKILNSNEWRADCIKWRGLVLDGKFIHWCFEWDGLPTDETCDEFSCCHCFPTTQEIEDIQQGLRDGIKLI